MHATSASGDTALMKAARRGHGDTVRVLIEAGAGIGWKTGVVTTMYDVQTARTIWLLFCDNVGILCLATVSQLLID